MTKRRSARVTLQHLWARLASSASATSTPAQRASAGRATEMTAGVLSATWAEPRPALPEVLAAIAVGDRLRVALAWEWGQLPIEPETWRATMQANRPNLVLLEVLGPGVPGWDRAGGAELTELLSWCEVGNIPVVAWATGDLPPADIVDLILRDAACVFVTDPEFVETWRSWGSRAPVEYLGPAASPRINHPEQAGPGRRRERGACLVIEAGGPPTELLPELTNIVGPAIRPISSEVDVCTAGVAGELPAALKGRRVVVGGWTGLAEVIGQSKVLIDGAHAPAATWSVLEASAAQTAVVTLPKLRDALPPEIAEHVAVAAEQKSLRSEVVARLRQPELRDREAVRLHRAVLAEHTYSHRVRTVLSSLGMDVPAAERSVSAVVPTNREHEIDNILANVGRQSHRDVELVIVAHGLKVDHADLKSRSKDFGVDHLVVIDADESLTLGACMNLGVDAASGAYIAKMDDDNFYGCHYLQDLLSAFDYTEAGIVGKWAHYVWLQASGAVVLRYSAAEHTYERRIQGGSMLCHQDVVRNLRFSDLPRAIDSDILDRAAAAGVKIYSADRFNFVSIRGADRHAHTWTVADSTFMTGTGQLLFYGDPRPHVEI